MKLRIGVDFDNTLISYDEVFRDLAVSRGWLPASFPASKNAVKARLLARDGDDLRWQRLQADAYGPGILKARPFPGCATWLKAALKAGHEVFLVSHKSETSHLDRSVRLRDSARAWLKSRKLMANGHPHPLRLKPGNVIFASTRDEKVAAIARLDLDVFIDDLLPVLEHRSFPARTLRVHFGRGAAGRVAAAGTWAEVSERLESLRAISPEAARAILNTFGRAPLRARPLTGGNNRIILVELQGGGEVLVKRYLVDARDRRDRAGAEAAALNVMARHGITGVPKLHYKDPGGAFTLLSVLKGRPMAGHAGRAQVLQAARFIVRLAALPKKGLPEAADSRRCLADYIRQVERRLARIEAGLRQPSVPAAARRLVREQVVPLKEALVAGLRHEAAIQGLGLEVPFPARQRIPSPSDFGFHNAILAPSGRVQFLDFEYFGVDDPAKLAADFTHHLGQSLTPRLRALFVAELSRLLPSSEAFRRRYALVRPLVGLEWVLITLNILSPEQLDRRRFSDPKADVAALIARRLTLARRLIRSLT